MSNHKSLKVLFIPLDSYGHINACVGIAQQIVSHGHRAIFALEQAWKGKVARYDGLEEAIYVDSTRQSSLEANAHWIEFMNDFKKTFPLEPIEALKSANLEMEEDFVNNFFNVHNELKAIIEDEVKPDVIVVDTYVTIPAVYNSGIPWVWVTSAQPLCSLPPHESLPPARTGYPTNGDRAKWKEFIDLGERLYADIAKRFNARLEQFGLPPPPAGSFCHLSPYLNMYAYPLEVDYLDIRPLPDQWQRFDHFIRVQESKSTFKIPEKLNNTNGKLIYISMGSLGCADLDLAKRFIQILAKSPNRFIYSLGAVHDQISSLPANIWGAEMVPQTQVLPLVDLVITHGGNNTFIESLYNGKPMIVTPLYDDQRDNAQRITELGLGRRLNAYTCEEHTLLDMIEELLADQSLTGRLDTISKRLQSSNSTEKAALAIESLVN